MIFYDDCVPRIFSGRLYVFDLVGFLSFLCGCDIGRLCRKHRFGVSRLNVGGRKSSVGRVYRPTSY